jgi:hypothetical protein
VGRAALLTARQWGVRRAAAPSGSNDGGDIRSAPLCCLP